MHVCGEREREREIFSWHITHTDKVSICITYFVLICSTFYVFCHHHINFILSPYYSIKNIKSLSSNIIFVGKPVSNEHVEVFVVVFVNERVL